MTSKIKVDNINKVSDDSNIIKKCGTTVTVGAASDGVRTGANNLQASDGGNLISQCGTTITLGASGDTINLASGASQSGFGRTGTVNWNTTPVTSTPTTGVNGVGYFIDASGGAKTINLPASPTAGDIMAVSDYAQIASTNNITVGRNGSNIQGDASDLTIQRNGVAFTLVFVDATKGWVVTDTGAEADKEPDPEFIVATGGTESNCGNDKIHTFTGPGTFTVNSVGNASGSTTVSYMVIAGGGGSGDYFGGGGGAGGFREGKATTCSHTASPLAASGLPVSAQGYPITVGAAGALPAGRPGPNTGGTGGPSTFSSITSAGGGGGGGNSSGGRDGIDGGSGGGGGGTGPSGSGAGNVPSVSPSQGNPGGTSGNCSGAGGGGATLAGANTPGGAPGGAGAGTGINPSSSYGTPGPSGPLRYFAGGGAGNGGGAVPGGGGLGGNGQTNTGGGGGNENKLGGSGIVIIRYRFQ